MTGPLSACFCTSISLDSIDQSTSGVLPCDSYRYQYDLDISRYPDRCTDYRRDHGTSDQSALLLSIRPRTR